MIALTLLLLADDAPGYYFQRGPDAPAGPELAIIQDCPVEMERETVFLWLEPLGARVRVSYVFKNPTDTTVSLLLVLPSEKPGDSQEMKRWIDGAEAPVSYSEREVLGEEMWNSPFGPLENVPGYTELPMTLAVTPVSFPPGKPVRVTEEYYLPLAGWSVFPLPGDSSWGIGEIDHERAILYPLSTVRYWGHGRVRDFTCIIYPGDPGLAWFRLQDDFKKKDEGFVFSQKDFAPPKDIWVIYYQPTDGFVSASSWLDPQKYPPENATDDDTTTAWVEGVKGNGEGEWIFLSLLDMRLTSEHTLRSGPVKLKGFIIWPGYQKSGDLMQKNAAPRQLEVTVYYDERPGKLCWDDHFGCYYPCDESFDENDENLPSELEGAVVNYFKKKTFTWTIEKKSGAQAFVLPEPLWAYGARFTIKSARPGTKYEDCCISEIKPVVVPFPQEK